MAYYRFTRLQQYINGQPTDTYTKGERVDDVDYSTYETCMGGSGNSRWVSIPQTVCYNGDLWSMEKEQISYDGGQTWVDTTNTRRASVIEPSASQCSGADNDWRVVYGEYICNGTTKCLKEAEYIDNSPTGRTRAGSIVELLSENCGVMYQWVDVPGEYVCVYKCGRADKYTKQKQQYSLDNGVHWEDTGETREGNFIEKNSADCGCDTSVPRWVTVSGEYVCVGTSKYTKEKEQTSTDGTNWTDTGNTRAGSLIEASSSSCASTRWVTVSGQYSCVGTDKYNLEKEQSSTDGTNWTDTGNTRAGSTLIEANSTDCGYIGPSYRWVTIPDEYVCDGTTKYSKEKQQVSYDSGSTWTDTGETQRGSIIEFDSLECGYIDTEGEGYFTTELLETGIINFRSANKNILKYSLDDGNTWTAGNSTPRLQAGSKILWKGNCTVGESECIGHFCSNHISGEESPKFRVYGNIMSLIADDDFETAKIVSDYQFYALFNNVQELVDAGNLVLPATTLGRACYAYMFAYCENLVKAPRILPATNLASICYAWMFLDCKSLINAPKLPATNLVSSCYNAMFGTCTSLKIAPTLPATILPNDCYNVMFANCTNLNFVECLAIQKNSSSTLGWLDDASENGTFIKAAGTTWSTTDISGVPSGWAVFEK